MTDIFVLLQIIYHILQDTGIHCDIGINHQMIGEFRCDCFAQGNVMRRSIANVSSGEDIS
ncbi:hypothetical protein SDC9_171017 [bioreactor metagenome]|uniref:Uncharacterized protein n=1 Tax=bioreactor metagenome TaxID=1076179 RepID=A0A645GIC5_9ZZZZ